jgi:hypothetical protein
MAQTIKLKRSNTSGSKPTTSNLALGEIALNTKDGLFFLRRNVDGTDSNDTIRAYTPEYLTEYDSQIDVTVTVATKTSAHPQNGTGSSSGYLLDGLEGPFLVLIPGNTYRFDQSDSTNSSHPLRFYLEADKTTSYTTGVTTNGTAGSSGAYTQIAVTESTPQVLYYQCSAHAYMGSGAFINSGAVTSTQIQANAVTAGKIASNSILTRHIDDNQIGIDQLNVSDGTSGQALTTNGSGTLSFSDVASSLASASDSNILPSTLAAGHILVYDGSDSFDNVAISGDATLASDGALTIATNAITSTMIAQNSILTKHIDDNQIGIDQLNVTDGSNGQVLTTDGSGTLSFSTVSSGSASDSFKTITISGQSDVVADSSTDTLTLAAGTGITLTTNASTDTITITGTTGLSANSVTATHIATGAVGASELASTAVTPGSYTLASITVDADGRITSASSGSSSVSDGSITTAKLADDAVTAAKLADTAVTAGTYGSSTASPQITIDAQGRITSASNQTISSSGGGGGIGLNLTVDVHEATGDGSTTAFDTGTTILSEDNTTVFVDGVYQEKGTYSTSGSTVTFSSAPPNGVSVEINNLATLTTGGALSHSSFNGDGSTTAFTLPKAPDSETDLIAFIDGVYQNNDSFNVSGTTLTFDTAPVNGTKVIIYTVGGVVTGKTHVLNTFDGDASTTAFTLTLDPVHENNTMVYVGGVYQPKGTYSISGTTLTFSEAPPSGTGNIEVNIGQVTTTTDVGANAVNAAAIAANAVGSSEIAGNAVTATQIAAGAVGASEISTSSTPTFAGANITNTSTSDSLLITTTEDSSTAAPVITLKRNSGSPADADYIGQLKFKGENDADQAVTYAKITGKIDDASDGTEKGIIEFAHIREGSQYITGRWKSDKLMLLNSTQLEVAGATTLSSTLGVTGATTLSSTLGVTGATTLSADLTVDTSTLKVDSSNNRVGIGTASPSVLLHTAGSAYIDNTLSLRTTDDQANRWDLYTHTDDTFRINYNGAGSDEIVLNTTGLGIGTDTPTATLTFPSATIAYGGASSGIRWTDGGTGTADAMIQGIRVGNDGAHLFMASNIYINTSGGFSQFDTGKASLGLDLNNYSDRASFLTSAAGATPTEKMSIQSDGRVAVHNGYTAPESTARFSVINAGDPEVRLTNTSTSQTLRMDHNSIRSSTAHSIHLLANDLSNRKLTIATSASNDTRNLVGIGTSNPGAALHINGSGSHNNVNDAHLYISKNASSDWHIFADSGADDYGIKAKGVGTWGIATYNHNSSAYTFRVDYGGGIAASNTTISSISDERLKKDIVDANSQWDDIKALRFRNFKWKDENRGSGTYLGLIAQEVEAVSPGLIEMEVQPKEDIDAGVEDPEYKEVKYSIVWMKAMKALQEAMTKIETLEEKVRVLESS